MIKELLGKSKEREDEAYVFTEEGEKKPIEEVKNTYIDEWKKKIYQKTERIDFSFWHGKEGLKGKKKKRWKKRKKEMSKS